MARVENPTVRASLPFAPSAARDEASKLVARAGTFAASLLAVAALVVAGTVLLSFGLLVATVAAPFAAVAFAAVVARGRRVRPPARPGAAAV
jgi:hypothetical protein